jgi:hypothetical protein
MFDIAEAELELRTKTAAEIETQTAYKWGSRALAALRLSRETGDQRWLLRYEEYLHEAIEHAAQVRDTGQTVANLEREIRVAIKEMG